MTWIRLASQLATCIRLASQLVTYVPGSSAIVQESAKMGDESATAEDKIQVLLPPGRASADAVGPI